jgi:hypothetical protein
MLEGRGARPRTLDLPIEPGVNGPDDYIGVHGAAAFFALVDGERVTERVELICAADVKVVKLNWLYRARLAYGAITLFEGGPEKGKSTILCDFAARVTRGHSFPGETETRDPGNVVMLVAEDDIEATVVPRLKAAGADLKRIFFLGLTKDEHGVIVPFHLSDDSERLRLKCEQVIRDNRLRIVPYEAFQTLTEEERQFLREHRTEIKAVVAAPFDRNQQLVAPLTPKPPLVIPSEPPTLDQPTSQRDDTGISAYIWGTPAPPSITLAEWRAMAAEQRQTADRMRFEALTRPDSPTKEITHG